MANQPTVLVEDFGLREAEREVSQILSEQESRNLEEDHQGSYMQRCGNNNPCLPGLVCSDIGFGKRCTPSRECLQTRLAEFEAKFDLEDYKARTFQDAGIAETELKEMFAGSKDRKAFVNSPSVEAVMRSVRIIWDEPLHYLWEMQRDCAMFSNSSNFTGTFHEDRVQYSGVHFEAGLLADFSATTLTANSDSPVSSSLNHTRVCVGAELLGGVEIGLVAGTAVARFDCYDGVSVLADLDAGAGLVFGAAGGFALNGNGFLETSIALGGGFGAGVSVCCASRNV